MLQPLVSICIPCYNAALFITETIQSVLNQTYANLEIIICDDQSKDNTLAIIKQFKDPRISIYVNEKNLGGSGNYNRVLSYATGTYVKLLCADDMITPNCIAKQVEAFETHVHDHIAFVTAHKNIINETGKRLFTKKFDGEGVIDGRKAIIKSVRSGTNIFGEPGLPLIKRDILMKTTGVTEDPYFTYCNDLDLLLKLLLHGNLYVLDETLFSFRIVKTSITSKSNWHQARVVKDYFTLIAQNRAYGISKKNLLIGKFMVDLMTLARNIILKLA